MRGEDEDEDEVRGEDEVGDTVRYENLNYKILSRKRGKKYLSM